MGGDQTAIRSDGRFGSAHVYLQSPFFLPDATLAEALTTAALSGIDVKVMVSARPSGNRLPDWAGNTFIEEIVTAGVQVFLYEKATCTQRQSASTRKSAPSARRTSISAASALITNLTPYSIASKWLNSSKRTSRATSLIEGNLTPRNIASAAPWRSSEIQLRGSSRRCCDDCGRGSRTDVLFARINLSAQGSSFT